MRLIDADKLEATAVLGVKLQHPDSLYYYFYEEETVTNAPTVKAIPVEWLHSIMERQLIFAMNSEMEGTTTVKDGVIHCVSGALACQVLANVIELWEKENEAN